MSGINELLNISASGQKINRNEDLKKVSEHKSEQKSEKTSSQSKRADQAQISTAARGMLSMRMDAKKYIDEVEQSQTLSENEVNQLKQKIENKYFISEDVVDKIVDKLVNLPNFLIQSSKS